MDQLFHNTYRIKTARLKNWDYAAPGWYYITICTKDRKHFFGEIKGGNMVLSVAGRAAQTCWQDIPKHFPFVLLDAYVIMPNHVHGIIIIDPAFGLNNVETQNFASLRTPPLTKIPQHMSNQKNNTFGPQSKNLASIIRGFKVGVSVFAKQNNVPFAWQPRFYDHIIRDREDLERIRTYIINNPKNWNEDEWHQ